MSKFTLAVICSASLILTGCNNNPSAAPPPQPPPSQGVEVHAPGVDVKVDKGGVDVQAPGADVHVEKK